MLAIIIALSIGQTPGYSVQPGYVVEVGQLPVAPKAEEKPAPKVWYNPATQPNAQEVYQRRGGLIRRDAPRVQLPRFRRASN